MSVREIYLILDGHDFYNEVQTMAQVFYPNARYIRTEELNPAITVKSVLNGEKCAAFVYEGGLLLRAYEEGLETRDVKDIKNAVKVCIYNALCRQTGIRPKWGILTGIRPAKLARSLLADGMDAEGVLCMFKHEYIVSDEKARLAVSVAENEIEIYKAERRVHGKSVHLYIGIPFCPTRCLYCSFTSYPIEKYEPDYYLDCLKKEINALPDVSLASIYIGGGTPTSLDENSFERLLSIIDGRFETKGAEYTVEAGRPDTITPKKLKAMRRYGVNRLSINPQTMNGETLALIGRRHSPDDIEKAFKMARDEGFYNINMDLILGLPKETVGMVKNTMERVFYLMPDSITVHTLAVKRASRLNEYLSDFDMPGPGEIEKMLKIGGVYAEKMNMFPYSMYRQKNMLGNFENVGWCREGRHSIFNIETLEETATILAAGAGAVTKIVNGDRISRIFNVKSVDEYMKRIDEIVGNKLRLKLD